ncbi:MAG: DNA translocase FtsK [Alphaproteobacteria bacterium]|nr:DNA translocase FtsK [Alphaproteobacteria bacterium]
MKSKPKFLPDNVSGALKTMFLRACGAVILLIGFWALGALIFSNSLLDGFACASTFGAQSFMGNIVGFIRYMIGFIPTAFLILCTMRWGASLALQWEAEYAPEYNILRGFIAVCAGAAAFGIIAPSSTFGGLAGAIVASDIASLIGGWGIIIGLLFLALFVLMSAMLLHIKWTHVQSLALSTWRGVRWVLALFHLVQPAEADEEYEEEYEEETDGEEDEEGEDEEEEKPKRKSRATRKRATVKTEPGEYELPDPMFLEASNFGKNVVTPEMKKNATAMEGYFSTYNIHGRVTGIRPGPIVTLYEFLPEEGTRIKDVKKTVDDMTRVMAAENIRIAHIPSTQLIGVEMANLNRQMVRFQGLVGNEVFIESKYKIPLALGVDIGGNPMYFDLAKMPHMLIAGRTGSGKSVFVQSIITSIVYHFTPDKCKMIIIDPKGSDFGFWDDIPHLITPIVKNSPESAVNALKWAVREMDDRYKQLQMVNARNIETYNEIMADKRAKGETLTHQVAIGTDEETGELLFETQEVDMSDMPYIVIIIDEVADLMALARKDVETCVQRIAQKARAAGIHLVMATQRPDTTVITGTIKSNFPTRVSFQARSAIDSMTTLGEKGAEQLLACGDMLFSDAGRVPVRIHGAFISDDELKRIGEFLRSQAEPEYVSGVVDGVDESGEAGGAAIGGAPGGKGGKYDELYAQAVEIVRRDKKTSGSYLQRRLGIGYNKAATLIERMEAEGILSAPDANNKRHIL